VSSLDRTWSITCRSSFSLGRKQIYPGHGRISNTPDDDLPKAVAYAQTLLNDCKMFFQAFIEFGELQDKIGSAFGYWKET